MMPPQILIPPLTLTIDLGTLAASYIKRKLRGIKNYIEDDRKLSDIIRDIERNNEGYRKLSDIIRGINGDIVYNERFLKPNGEKEVTVIINAHKREKTIEKSIRQMFEQNYPIKSMYISDSEGLDNTKEVVERLKAEFPNLHYWSRKGITAKSEKINCLVRDPDVELGDYVYLKDSSAVPAPGMLEKLATNFQNNDNSDIAALTTFGFVTPPKSYLANFFHYGKEWVNRMGQFRKTAQQKRRGMFVVCGASFMVKRDVLKEIEIPIGTQTEDTAYTWKLQEKGYRVGVVQDSVVYAEDVSSLKSQLKQTHRWYIGSWQNFFLNAKSLFKPWSKGANLGYSTILPGFLEASLYCGTIVSLPLIYHAYPELAKSFIAGDTAFSLAAPFISLPLVGKTREIPKEIFKTVIHYPQITAYKIMSSALWLSSGLKTGYDVITGKSKKWTGTWKKVY